MDRRRFLLGVGSGTTATVLAGCATLTGGEESSDSNDDRSVPDREPIGSDDDDDDDDDQEKGHNLFVNHVVDITPDTLTVVMTATVDSMSPYQIAAHCTPITPETSGEWEYIGYRGVYDLNYNENANQWEGNMDRGRLEYVMDTPGEDNVVSTVTMQAGANEDHSELPNEGTSSKTDYDIGSTDEAVRFAAEFDLNREPETNQPFAFTFTAHETTSDYSGEVLTQTPLMIRKGDEFFYGDVNQRHAEGPEWSDYDVDEVYTTEVEDTGDTVRGTINRVSQYGRYSQTNHDIALDVNPSGETSEGITAGDFSSYVAPGFLDKPLQQPWNVTYEIDKETIEEAEATADSYRGSNPNEDVDTFSHEPEIVNHEVVQDVASQLADVCEAYNATDPTEQIRVVADFVQYFDHTWELDEKLDALKLAPGTAHPVKTLARGYGDCKDWTVLGNALLQQDPFNFTVHCALIPEISFFFGDDYNDVTVIGHVSSAVPMSELEIDDVVEDGVGYPTQADLTFMHDGEEYAYLEMSGPFELGYVMDDWYDEGEEVDIDAYI